MPRYLTGEPDDPGPRATYEERERYLRDLERWATEGGVIDESRDVALRNLRRLEARHQRFLDIHSPIKAALWLALLRPVDELMARGEPEHSEERITGVVALAEAMARRGIRGDVSAFNSIADRLEG